MKACDTSYALWIVYRAWSTKKVIKKAFISEESINSASQIMFFEWHEMRALLLASHKLQSLQGVWFEKPPWLSLVTEYIQKVYISKIKQAINAAMTIP